MAGYIGSKSSVTQVDGYTEAETDALIAGADSTPSIDDNGNATAITIDSNENVGIGTSSPSEKLDVSGNIRALGANSRVLFGPDGFEAGIKYASDASLQIASRGNENITFTNGNDGAERMRIDGNVLIGTTTVNAYGATFREGSKYLYLNRDGGQALFVDRGTSDGSLIELRKNGTAVGSIGIQSDGFYMDGEVEHAGIRLAGSSLMPRHNGANSDNYIDVGNSISRFDDIYATNGTIQTSDFNEKQDIASLTATEMLVGKRISALFKTFRWKDSVAEKGDTARTHTGVIAQDVQAAFTAEGLDAGDYALFISSTWWETQTDVPAVEAVAEVTDEDGNVTTEAVEAKDAYTRTNTYEIEDEAPEGATERTRLGIRYPELLSFVAAYNEQRFASIEARLTALEA